MARKVFLSFLGAGFYKPIKYATTNKTEELIETRFVQEAFIKAYCKGFSEQDKIYIFLTYKAEKENWMDVKYLKESMLPHGLSSVLQGYNIDHLLDIQSNVPDGKNEEEIWAIFSRVYDILQEGDEIIFDVTHAFRSIPILAMTLFNYSKFTKNTSLQAIYYGAFDALNEDGTAQVWNLISYNSLQEYATGAAIFSKYGKADYLADSVKKIHSNINYNHPQFKQLQPVARISAGFAEYADLVSINHIPQAFKIAKKLKNDLSALSSESDIPSLKPFIHILEKLKESITLPRLADGELFTPAGYAAQIDLLDKCIASKNFAQAISIARELIISFVATKCELDNLFNYKEVRKPVEGMLSREFNNRINKLPYNHKLDPLLLVWDQVISIRNAIDHAFMDVQKKDWNYQTSSSKAINACNDVKLLITSSTWTKEDFQINFPNAPQPL